MKPIDADVHELFISWHDKVNHPPMVPVGEGWALVDSQCESTVLDAQGAIYQKGGLWLVWARPKAGAGIVVAACDKDGDPL